MLTADLVQYTRRGGKVRPRLVDPTDPVLLDLAAGLIELCHAHMGETRHDLESALREGWPPERPVKLGQGLARLLMQRCRFNVPEGVEPVSLRAAVATAAAASWRADGQAGTPAWHDALLAQVAREHGLELPEAEAALFADLEEHQTCEGWDPLTAPELLYRYNTAQVQGLLVRCERMRLSAPWPPSLRLRQLFGYLKFFGLLYREEEMSPDIPGDSGQIALLIDGPLSILESGARYGNRLAQFFPALLLWEQPWRLEAEVRPGKRGGDALLALEPHPWLKSHYPDRGLWVGEEISRFVKDFNAKYGDDSAGDDPAGWVAEAADVLLSLPGNRPCVPDVSFHHPGSGRTIHLEWFSYPDPGRVAQRLKDLSHAGLTPALLACRTTPALADLAASDSRLLVFRRRLLPGPVFERLRDFEGD